LSSALPAEIARGSGGIGSRFEALLWGFHNAQSGLCFPSYEKIADRAGCARSTRP